jgi:hypothetical protein
MTPVKMIYKLHLSLVSFVSYVVLTEQISTLGTSTLALLLHAILLSTNRLQALSDLWVILTVDKVNTHSSMWKTLLNHLSNICIQWSRIRNPHHFLTCIATREMKSICNMLLIMHR